MYVLVPVVLLMCFYHEVYLDPSIIYWDVALNVLYVADFVGRSVAITRNDYLTIAKYFLIFLEFEPLAGRPCTSLSWASKRSFW